MVSTSHSDKIRYRLSQQMKPFRLRGTAIRRVTTIRPGDVCTQMARGQERRRGDN
jgi:hypothetical protein